MSEYIGKPLSERPVHSYDDILKIFYQIASGLNHIDTLDITMQTLEPKNILIDELGNVKLFNYGMYYQTNQGEYVTFPIGFVLTCSNVYISIVVFGSLNISLFCVFFRFGTEILGIQHPKEY